MKPKALSLLALVVIAAAIAGYLIWDKSQKTTALVSASVPDIPQDISHPELSRRIHDASQQAKEGPNQIEGLAELSRLYDANGYTRRAWKCYATLVVVDPSEPRWHYRFGRILAGYGQLEEATPLFKKAISLEPDYLPSHIRYADGLLKQNEFQDAKSAYEDSLSVAPRNAYALVGLARIAIAEDDLELARTHLEEATKASNNQIGADLLADVYEKLGLPALEMQVLREIEWGSYADLPDPWSLALVDDCYDSYQVSIAGGWVVHQGDTRTGLRYVKRAVELDPDSSTLHFQIAGIYRSLNDLENAEKHYKRCVELQPDFADAWLQLIEIAKRKQSPTLVRRTLDSAMKAAPNSPSLNIEQGKLLLGQRRVDQAIPYFERSIELRPHEAVGYIELSQALLTKDEVDNAIELMRKALELEPTNPVALTTMAYAAILREDKEAADSWLRRIEAQPRITPEVRDQLIALYRQHFLK